MVGCIYFFRHIGLSPIKIGYSDNESPIHRFNQFKTYAPYGSEILGFIIISNPKSIEQELHAKYHSRRLKGEWFEISDEEVNKEVEFYSNYAQIQERNEFQIAWMQKIERKKTSVNKIKSLDKTKEELYNLLPDKFTTGEGEQISRENKLLSHTAFSIFLKNKELFRKIKKGIYEKTEDNE